MKLYRLSKILGAPPRAGGTTDQHAKVLAQFLVIDGEFAADAKAKMAEATKGK